MILDGFKLMVIGMGSVFVFLSLMVVIIGIMAKLLAPYSHFLGERDVSSKQRKPSSAGVKDGVDRGVIAAISAAVAKYRADRG